MNIFTRSLILAIAMLSSAAAQNPCSMCSNADATLANLDFVVPFLNVNGEADPTCREVSEYAPSVDDDDVVCVLIQGQASFCGCPESNGPVNACSLCPDGSSPQAPTFITPFEDTCEDLEFYVSHLSASECESPRVEILLRANFMCRCPNVEPECSLCPDNTFDLGNADAVIPFFNTLDAEDPTCANVRNSASLKGPDDGFDCTQIQVHAGFCGCEGVEPKNVCSFCPTGESPTKSDYITPTKDSCEDIETFFTHLDAEGCDSPVTKSILGLDYICGCPGAEPPACTLCPDGADPIDRDAMVDGATTCGKFADSIAVLTPTLCEANSLIMQAGAARCCSGDLEFPVCQIQQSPSMCTDGLLATTDEKCECYSFCNGEFVECTKFPGAILGDERCAGQAVTGCNQAIAVSSAALFGISVSALMVAFAVVGFL